jgi:osmotically-inducible protein OsmY
MTQIERDTDSELRTAIIEELTWTPDVVADRIAVYVSDGSVSLSGETRSFPEHEAVVNAVLRVRGVRAVADEIQVRRAMGDRSDSMIAHDCVQALERSVFVPRDGIEVTVHDHSVTLHGSVGWRYESDAAAKAVAAVPDVAHVQNSIRIVPIHRLSSTEAATQITAALVRHAELDARHIKVEVIDDTIRLSGQVSSWSERREAERAAWSAPGVALVDNQLTVE